MMTHVFLRNTPDAVSGNQVILFIVVLQDRDRHFSVMFYVMLFSTFGILPEVGRMFGLHDLFLPILSDPSARGSGNSPSCGSRTSMTLTSFTCDSSTSATSTTRFQLLPHTRRSSSKCRRRGRYCRTGGAASGLLHLSVDTHSLNERSCWPSLKFPKSFFIWTPCRLIRCLEHCVDSRELSVDSAPNIVHQVRTTEGWLVSLL